MLLPRTAPAWFVWECPPDSGVRNMAADATLLARVQPDRAVWRWYAWNQPTVSFGRHEAIRDRFSAASLERAGLAALPRPTGGRALLHVEELTYAVVLPLPKSVGWRDAYTAVNVLLVDALRMRFQELRIVRDPGCPVCGEQPTIRELHDLAVTCASPQVPEIGPDELRHNLDRFNLLDVREEWEWQLVNLAEFGAIHVPLGEIAHRAHELDASRDWVVVCKSGARSARAVRLLQQQGWSSVRSLAGGILAWQDQVQY